jgi:hypothetical protein
MPSRKFEYRAWDMNQYISFKALSGNVVDNDALAVWNSQSGTRSRFEPSRNASVVDDENTVVGQC